MKFNNYLLLFLIMILFSGCGKKEEEVIKIGRILPLTGGAADYGQSEWKGTMLAQEEINKNSGIDGRTLDIIFEDSQSDVKTGVNAMNKLVDVDKVSAVLGATISGITLAIAPIANRNNVLLLSPLSSQAEITDAGPFVFRVMPSDAFQSKILASWVMDEGYKKIALFYINNSWGKGVSNGFINEYENLDGNILTTEVCKVGDTDFRTQLLKIKNAKVQALICLTMPIEGGKILKQMKELNIQLPVYGGDAWSVNDLIETAGDAANGVKYTYPAQYNGPEYQKFVQHFKKKYNINPDVNAAGAYDAVNILSLCIKNLLDENKTVTGDNLRKEMGKIKNYVGATGNTTFDKNGDSIGKSFEKMIIIDGKREQYSE